MSLCGAGATPAAAGRSVPWRSFDLPDLQAAAVQTVLQQAEALSAEWAKPA